jgi:outer membrane protein TolC
VATAEADELLHERTLVELEGTRLTACVNLVKALGCGWQADQMPPPVK